MDFEQRILSDLQCRNIRHDFGFSYLATPISESLYVYIHADEVLIDEFRIYMYLFNVMIHNVEKEYQLEITDNDLDSAIVSTEDNEFITYKDFMNLLSAMQMGLL